MEKVCIFFWLLLRFKFSEKRRQLQYLKYMYTVYTNLKRSRYKQQTLRKPILCLTAKDTNKTLNKNVIFFGESNLCRILIAKIKLEAKKILIQFQESQKVDL